MSQEPCLKPLSITDPQTSGSTQTPVIDSRLLNMSAPLTGPGDVVQVRDLEVREYLEQMDPQTHPVSSLKPVYDSRKGGWFPPPDNMLLSVLLGLSVNTH